MTDPDAGRSASGGGAGERSAAPSPKPPRWSAERRASRVMGRKAPRKRLARCVISAFTRVFDAIRRAQRVSRKHPNVSRRSAHPSIGVSEAMMQTPGAENASRERGGLFEMVNKVMRKRFGDEPRRGTCIRPHPEERARSGGSTKSNVRARVSKGEDGPWRALPCFETPRLRAAPQHEGRRGHGFGETKPMANGTC